MSGQICFDRKYLNYITEGISVRKTVMMKNKERYQIEAVPLREKH